MYDVRLTFDRSVLTHELVSVISLYGLCIKRNVSYRKSLLGYNSVRDGLGRGISTAHPHVINSHRAADLVKVIRTNKYALTCARADSHRSFDTRLLRNHFTSIHFNRFNGFTGRRDRHPL